MPVKAENSFSLLSQEISVHVHALNTIQEKKINFQFEKKNFYKKNFISQNPLSTSIAIQIMSCVVNVVEVHCIFIAYKFNLKMKEIKKKIAFPSYQMR